MTSRQRVLKSLHHKEPDRVPIDLGGTPGATGIHAITYNKLKKALGLKGGTTKVYDPWQQLAKPEPEVLQKIGADVYPITFPPKGWRKDTLPDGSACYFPVDWQPIKLPDGSWGQKFRGKIIARRAQNGLYYDPVYAPLATASVDDLKDFDWPAPYSFYQISSKNMPKEPFIALAKEAKHWYENSDFALLGTFGGSIFEAAYGLRGFEKFMEDLLINRKFAEALLDKLVKANIEYAKRYLDAVKDYVQVIMVGGEDIGTQQGPVINPELYREVIKPRQERLWKFLKDNSSALIFVHSCGSIYDFLSDFIDAGADIINPVQLSAANMESKKLKEEFGDRLTFWGGGCDTQKILPHGTVQQVQEEVRRRIKDFAPGGGFIFAQVHNIQPDVPVENILAMYEAVKQYGKYPIC
ncbi:methyltransferase [Candidatus Aerophobetes bacterium]|nr:methyltransferase [Candidatus Aerophobetes bacterium]